MYYYNDDKCLQMIPLATIMFYFQFAYYKDQAGLFCDVSQM